MKLTITVTAEILPSNTTPLKLETYIEDALFNAIGDGILTGPFYETEVGDYEIVAKITE